MKKIISLIALFFMAITLIGCYESTGEIFEVQFYVNNELFETQEVVDGDKALFIEPSQREGFVFEYWTLEGKEYTFKIRVTKSISLNAKYKEVENTDRESGEFNFYYINDTHGAVLNAGNEMGLSRIGNLIIDEFNEKPEETIFIAGGDIFQGQLISNANRGAIMIELFNEMKLDALVLGNHEFDWGIEEILKYFDPNSSGVKADFPVLGANIFKRSDNELLDFVEPYTIVERNNTKIGIIGIMGQGLESSIMLPRIEDYYFADPLPIIQKYAKELREEKGVDVVIVSTHGDDIGLEYNVGQLSGDSKVDLYFKAHTHQVQSGLVNGMPYLQAGSNGQYLGRAKMIYEINDDEFYFERNKTILNHLYYDGSDERLNNANSSLEAIINNYLKDMDDLLNETIITAGSYMDQSELSYFITKVIKTYTNADIALHNSGGTRAGFYSGQAITAADVFKVFPFDNRIVLVEVMGDKLNRIRGRFVNYSDLSSFESNKTYLVATNDYIYFGNRDSFGNDNHTFYELDLYELLLKVLRDFKASGLNEFTTNTPLP